MQLKPVGLKKPKDVLEQVTEDDVFPKSRIDHSNVSSMILMDQIHEFLSLTEVEILPLDSVFHGPLDGKNSGVRILPLQHLKLQVRREQADL